MAMDIAEVQPASTVNCTGLPTVLCSRLSTSARQQGGNRWEGVCAAPVFVLAAPARPVDRREPSDRVGMTSSGGGSGRCTRRSRRLIVVDESGARSARGWGGGLDR